MVAGQLASIVAAIFAGAALYINVAEQPARAMLEDRAMLAEWKPSYKRGFAMQASLAILGFLVGTTAWWQTGRSAFLVGAIILLANWPYTLVVVMPVNRVLMGTKLDDAGPQTRILIERWARLHAGRTALGFAATLVLLWASIP